MSEEINNDPYRDIVEGKDQEIMDQVKQNGLGKASMARFQNTVQDSDLHLGWIDTNLELLPSAGKFYPADSKLQIRSAQVAEIRHFSTLDESNLMDIEDKLNAIIKACTKFKSGSKMLSYKDILEEDRIFLLLSIRDLTFPEAENKLMLKGTDSNNEEFDVELSTKYFDTETVPDEIEQYYDSNKRAYVIQTKSAGEVIMAPPTVGVMEEVTKFMQTRQRERKSWDQSFLQILPYIRQDWRGFNSKKIFEMEIEFHGWSERKYMVIYRLAEKLKIGVKPELKVDRQGEEVLVPLNFPGGIKSLFVISDLSSELL
jgi:hypothetical protein